MRTFNQIRSDISVVGRGLTGDKNLKYIWGGVPAGAHAAYSFKENAVLLPIIDQDKLSDTQLTWLMAWDRHERLHWEKSCGKYMEQEYSKLNSLEQELMQRFEDSRIETGNTSMTASEMEQRRIYGAEDIVLTEKGNDENLYAFRMHEYENVCSNSKRIAMNNRWSYLAMALQFKIAGYGDFPIPEELQEFFDIGWKIVSDGRFTKAKKIKEQGTWIIGQLAKEVYKAWEQKEEQQEKEKEDQEDSENSEDSGDSEDSISSEFEKSNVGEDKLDPNQIQIEVGNMSIDVNSENEKEVNSTNTKELKIPYNMEDEDVVPKEFPDSFSLINSQISSKAQELKGILSVILRSRARTSIQKNRLNGRINKRVLSIVPTGKTRVMQKKTEGIDLNTDVQIVIDLSGSMWSGTYNDVKRSVLAACVAICICEALSNISGINVEVIGFNSLIPKYSENAKGMSRSSDRIITYFFKKFDENYSAVKDRMGSMAVHLNDGGSVGGCNVDHEVIWRGAHRLIKRGKKRKIQFVLSDGQPSGCGGTYKGLLETELIRVNEKIKSIGIEQVAIGIQDNNVEKFYENSLVLYDLEKLDQEALLLIAKMFLSK
jgi:hypothetical protein